MTLSDGLHQLIHKLTPSEKRYVQIYAKRHTLHGENKYMKLFDEILKQEVYDAASIKNKIIYKHGLRDLNSGKLYLKKLIGKSLREFYSGADVTREISDLFCDEMICTSKFLYDQSERILSKIEKLAERFEKFPALLECYERQRRLLFYGKAIDAMEKLETLQSKRVRVIELMEVETQYQYLYSKITFIYKEQHFLHEKNTEVVKAIMENDLMTDYTRAVTFSSKHCFFMSHRVYHNLCSNPEKSLEIQRSSIQLLESDEARIKDEPLRYFGEYNIYIRACRFLNRFREHQEAMTKMKKFLAENPSLRIHYVKHMGSTELLYYMNTGEIQKGIDLVENILEEGFAELKQQTTKSRALINYYNFTIIYFFGHKMKSAHKWLNMILNEKKSDTRKDIQDFARVLELLFFFEMNTDKDIIEKINALNRHFKGNDETVSFERLILKYLKKLAEKSIIQKRHPIYIELRDEIAKFRKDNPLKRELGVEEIEIWVNSKIAGKSIPQLVRDQFLETFPPDVRAEIDA